MSSRKDDTFMNRIRLVRLIGIGATTASMALFPIGAYAGPDDSSQTTFTLTITENKNSRNVILKCGPTGGDHPLAAAACNELQAVDGHFQDLGAGSASTRTCTKEFRSVSASANGVWKDRQVSYQLSTGNMCKLHRSTGSVFAF